MIRSFLSEAWRSGHGRVPTQLPAGAIGYTLRVLLAVSLALFAAYALELQSPASAATTVVIVSSASRGAVLSKAFWRLAGTMAGAAMAVLLIALFAQSPYLFVAGMALWLGLCTFISSLLRYFRSYGAVLAGYTVTLVAFGALPQPGRIFELALARVAVVGVGVIASALVFLVTDPGPGAVALENQLGGLIAAAARAIRTAATEAALPASAARSRVAENLTALDQAVEYAAAEDAGLARFAGDLRLAVAELFAALTGGLHVSRHIQDLGPHGPVLLAALDQLAGLTPPDTPALMTGLNRAAQTLRTAAETCDDLPLLSLLDQAVALLDQFGMALQGLAALRRRAPHRAAPALPVYVNLATALRNGARAALAVALAGLFWITSAWPQGGTMIAMLGPMCGLMAQADSAAAASLDFFRGIAISSLGAFACAYLLLPHMEGFPLLLLAFLPFVALGTLASTLPRLAPIAPSYLTFLVIQIGPANPMHFDIALFLNNALAYNLGAACGVLTFRVLLPPNPVWEAQYLARSIRSATQRLARRTPAWSLASPLAWEHLQHQKMVRLSRRLAGDPARRAAAMRDGEAALRIGRILLRLRHARPAQAAVLQPVFAAARRLLASPHLVADRAAEAARQLGRSGAAEDRHLAAALRDLAVLTQDHAGFLRQGRVLPDTVPDAA